MAAQHLAMMAERFRGQLENDIQVGPGLDAIPVPRLLIQPLVENALKHGLAARGGRVSVAVRRRNDDVEYAVSDDGAGCFDVIDALRDTVASPLIVFTTA